MKKCFDSKINQRQREKYRCLLVDDHDSHVTNEVIQLCLNRKIVFIYFSSHTTHMLQLLNVSVFLSLIIVYKIKLKKHTHCHNDMIINKKVFLEICFQVIDEVVSKFNVTSA